MAEEKVWLSNTEHCSVHKEGQLGNIFTRPFLKWLQCSGDILRILIPWTKTELIPDQHRDSWQTQKKYQLVKAGHSAREVVIPLRIYIG